MSLPQDVGASSSRGAPTDLDEICTANLLAALGEITFFFKDIDSRFIKVSVSCARLTGRTPEQMLGLTDFDLTDHAHASELLADERRIIATREPMIDKREVGRLANRPGTLVETSKFPLLDVDGTVVGTFGYSRDVTRWALAEENIARSARAEADAHAQLIVVEARLRDVLDGSTDAIATFDRQLRYEYVNPAAVRMRSMTRDELIGRTDRQTRLPEGPLAVWEAALRQVLETGEPGDVRYPLSIGADGEEHWFHTTTSAARDASGAVVGVRTSTRDISATKRVELELSHRVMHDSLTGLANRTLLTDRLDRALARPADPLARVTLLVVDLDHFKEVNDTHGHEAGDRVLVEVARRLRLVTRSEDTVARLGGDEFCVLCDRVVADDPADAIADRIVRSLERSYDIGSATLRLSASVGAVVADPRHADASSLLRRADAAMYRAKSRGRNRFELVDPADLRS